MTIHSFKIIVCFGFLLWNCLGYQKICRLEDRMHSSLSMDNERTLRSQMRQGSIITQSTRGEPWPRPQFIKFRENNLTVLPDQLKFQTTYQCDILVKAIQRYKEIIFAYNATPWTPVSDDAPSFTLLNIEVLQSPCEKYPYLGMNENYTLDIWPNGTGLLRSPQIWGTLRGLETFSQLFFTADQKQWYVRSAKILDYPRFGHRGILLDTSRHFLSMSTILKNLDLMAYNKFNVFHWHIVDDHSFPYVSTLFPDLSGKGAYSPRHVYRPDDVRRVVEYARLRGIRVVPEFDTPGHTYSWNGQPNLLTPCYDKHAKPDGTFGPIDPSNSNNYDFLTAFFKEAFELFPDRYVHLGGDEVSFDCWSSNPSIKYFMGLQGYGEDYSKLEQDYIKNLLFVINRARNDTGYVVWQEVVDNDVQVKPDTIIHVWKGYTDVEWGSEMARVTEKNLSALLSSCWYLNYISYGNDWPTYYKCDPHNFRGTLVQKNLVIGGEACMWGEFVDESNLIPRLWPRASAVAERLWSSADVKDVNEAVNRMEEHRCRLMGRGFPIEPANGPGFCPYQWA